MKYEDLRLYTYSNDALINGEIKGIVVQFTGLGGTRMIDEDTDEGRFYAEKNIIYVFPYINPWSWMNSAAVKLTDSVIDCLFEHYELPENTPVISIGGSMGGQCALVYCYYAKRTPAACAANCPVCDLPYHYTERPDLPRTMLSAFGEYDIPLDVAIKTASPLHLADDMPDIPYYIVHCEADEAVNKQMHSDRLVEALSEEHRVIYKSVPERGHCDLTPEALDEYRGFIVAQCEKSAASEQA